MEKKLLALLCSALLSASTLSVAEACTRITFATTDNVVVTGRNMDWNKDDALKLHIMPRNAQRSSEGKHPFSWTAKYGSVIAYSFNGRVANSGMNKKGLQADLLYPGEANYGEPSATARTLEAKKLIQYVLDNFATVSETESALKDETLHMVSTQPNAGLHFMVTDKSGANIIIEIFNGKLKLYLAASPSTVWVDLGKINFEEGERVLSLSDGRIKHGDITEQFLPVATR